MRPLPSMRAMQAFEAFGRLGSVSAAAAELGVSPGAISQLLQKFEAFAGVRLLERRGRSVRLTPRGQRFHAEIAPAFAAIRTACDGLGQPSAAEEITISCLPSLAGKWLTNHLLDWQGKHAHVDVRLTGEEQEPALDDGQVDFRISYGDAIRQFELSTALFTDWVVPACSPEFLARQPLRQPQDILGCQRLAIVWPKDQGVAPTWADWARSIDAPYSRAAGEVAFSLSSAAIDAAISGRGFVLAQHAMAAGDIASGRLVVPFDRRLTLGASYFLAWTRAVLDKPLGQELRSWLIATGRAQNARQKTARGESI